MQTEASKSKLMTCDSFVRLTSLKNHRKGSILEGHALSVINLVDLRLPHTKIYNPDVLEETRTRSSVIARLVMLCMIAKEI